MRVSDAMRCDTVLGRTVEQCNGGNGVRVHVQYNVIWNTSSCCFTCMSILSRCLAVWLSCPVDARSTHSNVRNAIVRARGWHAGALDCTSAALIGFQWMSWTEKLIRRSYPPPSFFDCHFCTYLLFTFYSLLYIPHPPFILLSSLP